MISTDSIKMDPVKVDVIKQWDTLTCVKEVCAFIGFCNFYCRFIRDFSKIAGPLNALIKKETKFEQNEKCDLVFKELKQKVCEAPILIYINLSKQCHVETNSSDYVNADVLFQEGNNRNLHLVAYFSRRIISAKYNYEIYDKKLLAIT